MSEEQLKAFLEKAKGDTGLQQKLKAASDADAVVAIAKEAGFMISIDELKKAHAEISDEELKGASGGFLVAGVAFGLWVEAMIAGTAGGIRERNGYFDDKPDSWIRPR